MPLRESLAALIVAMVWGLSFVAIKIGVGVMPPLMFSALRFLCAAVPAVFFVRPPQAPWRLVVGYGLLIGVAQFGLLFLALRLGAPAGLSSIVIQIQIFLTMGFAALLFGERPTRAQIAGGLIALAGLALIGWARAGGAQAAPFALVLLAGVAWALGNVVGKAAGPVDMLAFTVWSSLVAPLPLVALSLVFEGGAGFVALAHPSWTLVWTTLSLAYGATLFGYGVWARLLSRYPASAVTPFALLVPVFGMASAAIVFGERASAVEWAGAGLVFAGLACATLGARLRPPPLMGTRHA